MKKLNLLFTGVLFCTLVSARGIDEPIKGSAMAITNTTGSTLFKLYYKSEKQGRVKINIKDEAGNAIFNETLNKVSGFMRPYNFEGLPEGQYTISLEDENGKTVEKVNYKAGKVEKLIHLSKVPGEQNKYLLSVASRGAEDVFIYIFDNNGNLIHNEIQTVKGEFAQVYNLNSIESFTIEVADKFGVLKKITY
jgi:hypothetical protein